MKEFFNAFGYKDGADFITSMVHPKMLSLTVPISIVSGVIEQYFGLAAYTFVAFLGVLTMEFVTGVYASMISKKEKFSSIRMGRFGFRLVAWSIGIGLLHLLSQEPGLQSYLYKTLHSILWIWVSLQYFISFLENMGTIGGRSTKPIIRFISMQLNKYLDIHGEEKKRLEE